MKRKIQMLEVLKDETFMSLFKKKTLLTPSQLSRLNRAVKEEVLPPNKLTDKFIEEYSFLRPDGKTLEEHREYLLSEV